jgi:hypothetical protein
MKAGETVGVFIILAFYITMTTGETYQCFHDKIAALLDIQLKVDL